MFDIIKEFKINGRKYAYAQDIDKRVFVLRLNRTSWELFASAEGYGYLSIESAQRAFANRLFFEDHYTIADFEPCIEVPGNYLQHNYLHHKKTKR